MSHAPQLISTKLHIPETKDKLLPRHRLERLLDESFHYKLTLVCAPAGSGKTTLLGQWAKAQEGDVAWVSLDEYDNDIFRFWRYVIAAVDRKRKQFMRKLTQALNNADTGSVQLLLVQLINELQSVETPLAILLDDYHLITNDEMHRSFAYFLERMPSHIHCILATRAEPPLPLARLKASGLLQFISGKELNFTPGEGMDFCRLMNEELPETYARQLQERTEGWIAGMKLALLTHRDEKDYEQSLHLISDRSMKLSDYLFEEVYSKLPQEDRRFLRYTSILDMFCVPFCEAVTGQPGARKMLDRLDRANLFLVSLDRKGIWYRYHHLFSEFLFLELERREPELIPELRRRAAEWLRRNGFLETAVEQYLAGGHLAEALDVIGELLPSMIDKQWEKLYRWLGSVPRPMLEQRPELFLAQLFFMTAFLKPEANIWITRAEQLFLPGSDETDGERRQILSTLYLIKALHAVDYCFDAEKSIEYMRECVKYASDGLLLQKIEINPGEMCVLCAFHNLSPDTDVLDKFFQSMLELWRRDDPYVFSGFFHLGYGEIFYERGELMQAEQEIAKGWKIARRHRSAKLLAPAASALAVVYRAQGRHEEWERLLDEARSFLTKWGLAYWADRVHTRYIRLLLADGAEGDEERDRVIRAWMDKHGDILEQEEIEGNDLFIAVTAVRIHLAADRREEAEAGLNRIERSAWLRRRFGEWRETRRLRSLLRMRQGRLEEALDILDEVLAEAEANGTFRPFLDEGAEMKRLLELLVKNGRRKHIACARRILDLWRDAGASMHTSPSGNGHGGNILTPKERQVLEMMVMGMPNRLIAEKLNITLGTLKTHINHIYQKLMVSDRWSAVNRAKEWMKQGPPVDW